MSDNEKPTPHYQVMMGSYTVEEFVKQIDDAYDDNGEETKKGILIAPFQRNYQWHMGNYPLYFLDSLNTNVFVMPVILVEHKQQTWIIDGQQRLATLYCYIKGYQPKSNEPIKWKKLIMAIKDTDTDTDTVEACEWEKLGNNPFIKDNIKQTPIGYSFLFNVDHIDDSELLVKIFDRINNQGIPLSFEDTVRAYAFFIPNLNSVLNKYKDWRVVERVFKLLATYDKNEFLNLKNTQREILDYVKTVFLDDAKYFKIYNLLQYLLENYRLIVDLFYTNENKLNWFNQYNSELVETAYINIFSAIIDNYINKGIILKIEHIKDVMSNYRNILLEEDFEIMCNDIKNIYISKLEEYENE